MDGEPNGLRCILHGPASGARNMAVDEALMDAARRGRVSLRFYRWEPPCVSLGRHQPARGRYDLDAAAERGIRFVRRPTGGRAVFHHRELTYSVAAPSGAWGGLRRSYRRINRALLRGLASLGAAAETAPAVRRAPAPSGRACFRDPLPGEIVARGRKLVGSAQWRDRGALLQHGSLLLHDDQSVVRELRSGSPARQGLGAARGAGPGGAREDGTPTLPTRPAAGGADERPSRHRDGPGGGAAALSDLLADLPAPRRLAGALRAGFEAELGLSAEAGELDAEERDRAAALEERYRSDDWTWRR